MRLQPFYNTDGGAGTGGDGGAGGGQGDGGAADLIPRTEAQKAFAARDEAKKQLRLLQEQGLVLTPEQKAEVEALRTAAAQAEEDRKRKAGEFDQLRTDLLKKHEAEVTAARTEAQTIRQQYHQTLKSHAFAAALDWFGGAEAKTIMTPAIAAAFLGPYVAVEADEGGRESVVVKNTDGHVIMDAKTGRPAPFAQAIGELIGMLPERDSILRGSGKTGSGSSGGSGQGAAGAVDLGNLKPHDFKDPKVREALKREHAKAGGMVIGPAFER